MRMKKFFKWLIIVFIAVNLYSLIPIITFYLKSPPAATETNDLLAAERGL